ncbi:MAG: hypothetical protein DME24_20650 [Verrucomicrobia bacterium]|nr:MAG: hypothetical protein DME24_20650 [Verrucomicrobiota bacterium]
MNHPSREEWMSYLYDELNADQSANLQAHLHTCPDCKSKVNEWQAARSGLDEWRVPKRRGRVVLAQPMVKWAAAAAIVLSIGVGIGRLTSAPLDVQQVRAAIEPEMRQELRREFAQLFRDQLDKSASTTLAASTEQTRQLLAEFARAVEAKRTEDYQAINAALDKLQSQRLADFFSLKKDVDTMAVLTESGFRRAQQQLVQLADYTQPANSSNSPQH